MKIYQRAWGVLLLSGLGVPVCEAGPLRRDGDAGRKLLVRGFAFSNTSTPIPSYSTTALGVAQAVSTIPLDGSSSGTERQSEGGVLLSTFTTPSTSTGVDVPTSDPATASDASSTSVPSLSSSIPLSSLRTRSFPPFRSSGQTASSDRSSSPSSLISVPLLTVTPPTLSITSTPSSSATPVEVPTSASSRRPAPLPTSFSGPASNLEPVTESPTHIVPPASRRGTSVGGQEGTSSSVPVISSVTSSIASIGLSKTALTPIASLIPTAGSLISSSLSSPLAMSSCSTSVSISRFTLRYTSSIILPTLASTAVSTSTPIESVTTSTTIIDLSSLFASSPGPPSTSLSIPPTSLITPTPLVPVPTLPLIPTVLPAPISLPTTTVPPATYASNLAIAQSYNILFSTLNFSSPCRSGEIACIAGSQAQCATQGGNGEGNFQITDVCQEGSSCFAMPMESVEGVGVGCVDRGVAEGVLGSAAGEGTTKGEGSTKFASQITLPLIPPSSSSLSPTPFQTTLSLVRPTSPVYGPPASTPVPAPITSQPTPTPEPAPTETPAEESTTTATVRKQSTLTVIVTGPAPTPTDDEPTFTLTLPPPPPTSEAGPDTDTGNGNGKQDGGPGKVNTRPGNGVTIIPVVSPVPLLTQPPGAGPGLGECGKETVSITVGKVTETVTETVSVTIR